jgi:hypothetical protein
MKSVLDSVHFDVTTNLTTLNHIATQLQEASLQQSSRKMTEQDTKVYRVLTVSYHHFRLRMKKVVTADNYTADAHAYDRYPKPLFNEVQSLAIFTCEHHHFCHGIHHIGCMDDYYVLRAALRAASTVEGISRDHRMAVVPPFRNKAQAQF